MNQQYLTQETFHAFLSKIIMEYVYEDDVELAEYYELFVERNIPYQDFFQDSTVVTCDKVKIMCMMSRDNLKFHQLENVDDNDHKQLHRLLIGMFRSDTPTEDNELRMVHVLACMVNEKSDNVIANLIDTRATERQAIFMERMGDFECTALSLACHYNASIDTINALIAIGGRELVMMTDADGYTVLCKAICYNASIGTINALIAIGGRELVMMTVANGYTALHEACRMDASVEIINTLIDIGGRELLIATHDNERTAIHTLLNSHRSTNRINKASSLISSGIIQDQVGGEFGIGGLFNFASEEGQQSIFEHWNNTILPALEMNAALISRHFNFNSLITRF
jgi:hypothetical protein